MSQNDELLKTLTVLYVEDEASIRAMITRFLKRRVAVIYEAANGKEGLDIYNSNKSEIDLVITEVMSSVLCEIIKRQIRTHRTYRFSPPAQFHF